MLITVIKDSTGELISTAGADADVAPADVLTQNGLVTKKFAQYTGLPADKLWNSKTRLFDIEAPAVPTPVAPDISSVFVGEAEYGQMTPGEQRLARVILRALVSLR